MIKFIVEQKWLYDQGASIVAQFIGIFNTSLLIVLAGERLKRLTGIQHTRSLIIIAVLVYLIGTWLLALVLDRFGFFESYYTAANRRNYAFLKTKEAYEEKCS